LASAAMWSAEVEKKLQRILAISKCAAVIILGMLAAGCLPFTVLSAASGLYQSHQIHELKKTVERSAAGPGRGTDNHGVYRAYGGTRSSINWGDTGLRPYMLR